MSSGQVFVIAHYVYLQAHPLEQTGYHPRELLTKADSRQDAIEAAEEWVRERIRLDAFDQENWDARLVVRQVEHVVPANEETGSTGGTATFVFATLKSTDNKWRAGDGSTAQAVVLESQYASVFPEFMYQK